MIDEGIIQLAEEVEVENIVFPKIIIENDALQQIPTFLQQKKFNKAILVVDKNTNNAAGKILEKLLSNQQVYIEIVELTQNRHDQVIADEQTLIELLVNVPNETDVILAVGSGTIHDIVRFVAYKMDIPFVSVPTAASVDGFTSKGAPLIFRGFKNTIQTSSPLAVFADINVLKEAPQELTAAGFGDIVGKYTSLVDWKISSLVANEPYSSLAAELTWKTLQSCVDHVEKIAKNQDEGLKILMKALIESGLVMLILDYSRPASGSEHHLSHYWEMDMLKKDVKQLLHGAKVGVASTIIIDLYRYANIHFDINDMLRDQLSSRKLIEVGKKIKNMIDELPNSQIVRDLLSQVGGPTSTNALNIDDQLVTDSLNQAFQLRDRCTGLLLINQFKKKDIQFPIDL